MPTPPSKYGCWPTEQQRLLLRAALLDGQEALTASLAWRAEIDLDRMDPGSQRLLPLLYRAMTARGEEWGELGRVRGVARQTWYRNRLLIGRLAGLIDALQKAGVRTLLLEGAPLCLSYYGDLGLRPMVAADLLVRDSAAPGLLPTVRAAGWEPRHSRESWPPRFASSQVFAGPQGLDLHLHCHVLRESAGGGNDDSFWEAARTFEAEGVTTRALHPSDQLLYVVAHGCRRSPISPVRWLADAAVVIRASGTDLDWRRFVSQAQAHRLTRITGRALAFLKALLGVPIPDDVIGSLTGSHQTPGERVECWGREGAGPLRTVAEKWGEFNRSAGRVPDWSGPLGFPRYLRDRMGLARLWQVPGALSRRILQQRP